MMNSTSRGGYRVGSSHRVPIRGSADTDLTAKRDTQGEGYRTDPARLVTNTLRRSTTFEWDVQSGAQPSASACDHDPLSPQQRLSSAQPPRGSSVEQVKRFIRTVPATPGGTRKRRLLSAGVAGLLALTLVGGSLVSLMMQARESQAVAIARQERALAAEVPQGREATEELSDAR